MEYLFLRADLSERFQDRDAIGHLVEVVTNARAASLFVLVCSFSVSRILNGNWKGYNGNGVQIRAETFSNRIVTPVGSKYSMLYIGLASPLVQEDDPLVAKNYNQLSHVTETC
jgi:hypothetical protein